MELLTTTQKGAAKAIINIFETSATMPKTSRTPRVCR